MIANQPGPHRSFTRFTPQEQAVTVWLSHTMILVFVTAIMVIGVNKNPPPLFFVAEGLIWFMFAALILSFDNLVLFLERYFPSDTHHLKHAWETWQRTGLRLAIAAAFVLEFVAVTPLLIQTGGPISSPFALLVLAFALATPLLANQLRTVMISFMLSLAYYAVMVERYGFGNPEARPDSWVYLAVITFVLVLAVCLTVLDRLDQQRPGGTLGESGDKESDPLTRQDGR